MAAYQPYIEWLPSGQQHGIIRLFEGEAGTELASDGMPAKGFVWTASCTVQGDTFFVRATMAAPPQGSMTYLAEMVRQLGCSRVRWERAKGRDLVVREFRV